MSYSFFSIVLYTDLLIEGPVSKTVRIFELDSAVSTPERPWPLRNQRLDGVMICYDVAEASSYARIPDLIGESPIQLPINWTDSLAAGFSGQELAIITLACKSDLEKAIPSREVDAALRRFGVGLVEVSANNDGGKKKMRSSFSWAIKAIGRHRRECALYPITS